jgi:cyclic-di-AMP phosphodiesterase PgpH
LRTTVKAWSRQALPFFTTLIVGLSGLSLVVLPRLLDPSGIPEPLVVGRLVDEDIRAPRPLDVVDEETTDWMEREAQQAVRSVYDHDVALASYTVMRLEEAFLFMRQPQADGSPPQQNTFDDRRVEFFRLLGAALEAEDFADLRARRFDTEIEQHITDSVKAGYPHYVVADRELLLADLKKGITVRHVEQGSSLAREDVLTKDDLRDEARDLSVARADMASHLRESPTLTRNHRRLVLSVAERVLKPNLTYNRDESEKRRALAVGEVKPVIIPVQQGERIARKGDRLTRRQVLILKGFLTHAQKTGSSARAFGTTALLAIFALATLRFSRSLSKRPLSLSDGLFATAVLVVQMLVVRAWYFTLSFWDPSVEVPYDVILWAAPFSAGALLVRLFLAHEVGLVVGMVSAVAASVMFEGNFVLLLYVLSGALVAATPTRKRNRWWQIGLEVALAQALVIFCNLVLNERYGTNELMWVIPAALASGMSSAIICAVLSPLLEAVLGFTTERRLKELASLNHPLLKQLIVTAPGTYHHSIIMGQLAEAAASDVGANAWLAKVGAHFHDIGKLESPQIYEENRRRKAQGELLSDDEWKTIKNHVRFGVKLAQEHRLGSAVLEIIVSHHGQRPLPRSPSPLLYDGPGPVSREAAIVMLADAVEACTRDLGIDSARALQTTVYEVCDSLVRSGELDGSDLSLSDITSVKAAFVRVLSTIRRAGDGRRLYLAHDESQDDPHDRPNGPRALREEDAP